MSCCSPAYGKDVANDTVSVVGCGTRVQLVAVLHEAQNLSVVLRPQATIAHLGKVLALHAQTSGKGETTIRGMRNTTGETTT